MKITDQDEERIGQENEDDLQIANGESFSDAVLWGTDWTSETIISQLKKGNIELNPNFQRRDAWGTDRKSRFIESIILGLPIPQIILAERKDKKGAYIVIDGKQRLLSIRQFSVTEQEDEFEPLKLHSLKVLTDLNGKTYQDVNQELDFGKYLSAFENQTIRTILIRNWPNQSFLYTVFLRLNTGSLPLSPQELRQALNPGDFTSFADSFSVDSPQIKKALRLKKPDYRMRDVELVVRYFSFKLFIEDYTGNLKDFLDKTCEKLNQTWKNDSPYILTEAIALNNSIETSFEIFGENAFTKFSKGEYTGTFNRPIFDIMTYYFSVPEIADQAKKQIPEVVEAFEHLCSNDIDFLRSLETSTKNIEPTTKRYYEWGNTLKNLLGLQMRIPQRTPDGIKVL
ncbi:MAG: DUF262 domain-containing protein [Chitinophagaceae bacterium]|nr:DUF262 domain-containing protein [Chitinophagaceae bacterium]